MADRKRKREPAGDGAKPEEEKGSRDGKEKKRTLLPSLIKNKVKRMAVHAKVKREKRIEKKKKAKSRADAHKRALELGEEVIVFLSFAKSSCLVSPDMSFSLF